MNKGTNAEKKDVSKAIFWLSVNFFVIKYMVIIKEEAKRLGRILATIVKGISKLKPARR